MTPTERRRERSGATGSARPQLRAVRAFLSDDPWAIGALVVVSFVAGLLESALLLFIAQIAAALVEGSSKVVADVGPVHLSASISALLVAAVIMAVLRVGLMMLAGYLPAKIASDFESRTRLRLFDAYLASQWAVQSEEREGHLQELTTNQVTNATYGVIHATYVVSGALAFAALVGSALLLSAIVAAVVLAAAVLVALLLRPLNRMGQHAAHELSAAELDYAAGISESVRVSEETQVFGIASSLQAQVDALVSTTKAHFFKSRFLGNVVQGAYQSVVILLVVGGLAGLYWSGAGRIATLGAVVLMLVRSAMYGQQAQASYHQVLQAVPYRERLEAAEGRFRASVLPSGTASMPRLRNARFDGVAYAYRPDRDVLTDVGFEVTAGEAIGIVGPSGAGKSTLVQLLLRLRSPRAGRYTVNGVAVDDIALADWRRRVTYVSQEPRLLHASVRDNISFFRDLDGSTVERAARLAHVHDEILGWSDGYDTVIGQRADGISGGQRQRICLARALASDPEMLVLDEPTSALDLKSESLVQESLASLRGHLTLFVVAHRLSTLTICNRIMVIDGGTIQAFGPISEIEDTNAFYRAAAALTSGSTPMNGDRDG